MLPVSLKLTVTHVMVVQARYKSTMANLKILLSRCQIDKRGRQRLRQNKPGEVSLMRFSFLQAQSCTTSIILKMKKTLVFWLAVKNMVLS